jgi:hypothetical protein
MPLRMPTAEEIDRAWREIDDAGPDAHDTMELSLLTLKNKRMNDIVGRLAAIHLAAMNLGPESRTLAETMVRACIMTGLNYGLRIGDERLRKAKP